jgi:hypothetical protein
MHPRPPMCRFGDPLANLHVVRCAVSGRGERRHIERSLVS